MFEELKLEKLPTIKTLQTEYGTFDAEKKKLYFSYHAVKEKMFYPKENQISQFEFSLGKRLFRKKE